MRSSGRARLWDGPDLPAPRDARVRSGLQQPQARLQDPTGALLSLWRCRVPGVDPRVFFPRRKIIIPLFEVQMSAEILISCFVIFL